jgi:hypothetical protein
VCGVAGTFCISWPLLQGLKKGIWKPISQLYSCFLTILTRLCPRYTNADRKPHLACSTQPWLSSPIMLHRYPCHLTFRELDRERLKADENPLLRLISDQAAKFVFQSYHLPSSSFHLAGRNYGRSCWSSGHCCWCCLPRHPNDARNSMVLWSLERSRR